MERYEWTTEEDKLLLKLKKEGKSSKEIADELTKRFNFKFTAPAIRGRYQRISKDEEQTDYKETIEILHDGSHRSDKLLRMSSEQAKDVNYLLNAHGFNASEWELVSAKNNIWNVYSKKDKIQTLYSSKITVKPKKEGKSLEKLLETIKRLKPIYLDFTPVESEEERLLEIPFFDSHFGVSDYDYYKETQHKTMNLLLSRRWSEVLFIIGQDMLHNDNFKGQTVNGTQIEIIDLPKAWEDAFNFYQPMIELSLEQSENVKIIYSTGNHDLTITWAFVQMLKKLYPQVIFDDSIDERKIHTFGQNFIGITHGDKARKNLHNIFPVEFPVEWSKSKNREVHIGHFHVEDAKDVFGMVIRTLATRNKTDTWHKTNGFIGAHKRFMLFEYSETELESIHYV